MTALRPILFLPFANDRDDRARYLRNLAEAARLWASYGDYDRQQFVRNCGEFGIPYPFGPGHLNVKTLLAVTLGLKREVGMRNGLAALGLPLEGTHHRAGDDAWNITAILAEVLRRARATRDR